MKVRDLTGEKFGHWTVLRKDNEKTDSRGRHDFYICQCECGKIHSVNKWGLIKGTSKSCGCLSRERLRQRDTKHDLSRTKLYHIFYLIRERCYNPKHISYKNYGGRGIRICKEWLDDIESFVSWCKSNGYRKGLTIDRINVNGNYEPSNCRFATTHQQQRNRRDNRTVVIDGKRYVLIDACEKFGVKLSNAHTYYTRCNGDKYIMEKYFKNHATIKRLPTDCV